MSNNINNSEISVIEKEKKRERFFLSYFTLSTFFNLFNQYFKERIDTDEVARSFINKIENYFNVKYIFKNNGFDINHKKSIIIQQHYAAADAAIALLNFPETKFAYYYTFHNIPILGNILDSLEYQPVGQTKDKNSLGGASELVKCAENTLNGGSPFAFFPEGQCNSILNPNIRCQTGGLFGIFKEYFQNDSVVNQANIPIIISNVGLFLYGKSRPVRFSNEINEIIKRKDLESEIVAKLDKEKGIVFLNQSFESAFKDEMKINEYDINKNIFLNEILNLTGIKFDNSNQLNKFLKEISDEEKGVLDFEKFKLNIKDKLDEFLRNKIEILESKLAEEKKFKDKSSKFIDMIGYEINFFKNLFEISNKDSKMTIIKDKSLKSFFDQFNAIINIIKKKDFNDLNFDEEKFFCHKMIELIFRLNNKLIIKSINNDIDLKNELNNSYSNIIFGFEKEELSLKLSLGNFNEVAFEKLEHEKLNFFL